MDEIDLAQTQEQGYLAVCLEKLRNKRSLGSSYNDQEIVNNKIVCKNCGEPIPKKRLEIIPHAIYCVECAEELGL